jgi:hypothetical protein
LEASTIFKPLVMHCLPIIETVYDRCGGPLGKGLAGMVELQFDGCQSVMRQQAGKEKGFHRFGWIPFIGFGRPGGIRTPNTRIWSPVLYQFELLACNIIE